MSLLQPKSPCQSARSGSLHGSPQPAAPKAAVGSHHPLRHVSPRKFQQMQQQQRAAAMRRMPLSPLSACIEDDRSAKSPTKRQDRMVTNCATSTPVRIYEPRESVPWNPAWLPNAAVDQTNAKPIEALLLAAGATGSSPPIKLGTMTLDAWLHSYEQEFLAFESLEKFVAVKLPEALAFCDKLEQQTKQTSESSTTSKASVSSSSRFHVRLRIAVFAHLVERTIFAMTQSAGLSHAKQTLFLARQELFRAMFADYDNRQLQRNSSRKEDDDAQSENGDDDTRGTRNNEEDAGRNADSNPNSSGDNSGNDDADTTKKKYCHKRKQHFQYDSMLYGPTASPRTLGSFLTKVPYVLKLREDTQRRELRFKRNQAVLRRIVQSLYRSLGSVFNAWRLLVRHKKDERLNNKGAQLTAMVVQQRGLVRSVFVEWSKVALRSKIRDMKANELEMKQHHEQVLADLHKEIFLLREKNHHLQLEVLENQRYRPVSRKIKPSDPVVVPHVIPMNLQTVESVNEATADEHQQSQATEAQEIHDILAT